LLIYNGLRDFFIYASKSMGFIVALLHGSESFIQTLAGIAAIRVRQPA